MERAFYENINYNNICHSHKLMSQEFCDPFKLTVCALRKNMSTIFVYLFSNLLKFFYLHNVSNPKLTIGRILNLETK